MTNSTSLVNQHVSALDRLEALRELQRQRREAAGSEFSSTLESSAAETDEQQAEAAAKTQTASSELQAESSLREIPPEEDFVIVDFKSAAQQRLIMHEKIQNRLAARGIDYEIPQKVIDAVKEELENHLPLRRIREAYINETSLIDAMPLKQPAPASSGLNTLQALLWERLTALDEAYPSDGDTDTYGNYDPDVDYTVELPGDET